MSRYKSLNSTMITGSMCHKCQKTTWVRYPSNCNGIEYICLNCGSIEYDVIEYSDIEELKENNLYMRIQNTAFKFFELFDGFHVIIIACILFFSTLTIIGINLVSNDLKKKKEEQIKAISESTISLPLYKEENSMAVTIPSIHITLPTTFANFKDIDTIRIPKIQFVELITSNINNSTHTEKSKKNKK